MILLYHVFVAFARLFMRNPRKSGVCRQAEIPQKWEIFLGVRLYLTLTRIIKNDLTFRQNRAIISVSQTAGLPERSSA